MHRARALCLYVYLMASVAYADEVQKLDLVELAKKDFEMRERVYLNVVEPKYDTTPAAQIGEMEKLKTQEIVVYVVPSYTSEPLGIYLPVSFRNYRNEELVRNLVAEGKRLLNQGRIDEAKNFLVIRLSAGIASNPEKYPVPIAVPDEMSQLSQTLLVCGAFLGGGLFMTWITGAFRRSRSTSGKGVS